MLITQTFDKLDALGLFGMAMGLREQLESTQYANLSFESDWVCWSTVRQKRATAAG
jgi:hypothetical protein